MDKRSSDQGSKGRIEDDLDARRLLKAVDALPPDRREKLMGELQREGYSPQELSEMINKPLTTIHRWLRQGEITGAKIGRTWLIPREEIDRILGRTSEPGSKRHT